MKLFSASQLALASSLIFGASSVAPMRAQANDMFSSKVAAEQRAKQLRCTGSFAMGKEWMPCKDFATYEKAVSKKP